jgi:uncharacterized FlaG/YvyC family protein
MTIDALNAVKSFADAALAATPAKHDPDTRSAASQRAAADASSAVQARVDKLLALGTTRLDFQIDPTTQQMVLSILDAESGNVIYKIPSDVALNITKWLDGSGNRLLSESV